MPRNSTTADTPRAASTRSRHVGSGGFGHAQVAEIQRARIVSAMFDVATERGAGDMSVAHVVERSGVSRRTFYEAFNDLEDCFLAAFEEALAFASRRVVPAYNSERKWRDRIRVALLALLYFFEEERVIAHLLVVESLSAGPRTLEHRSHVLAALATVVDEGRKEVKMSLAPPPLTADGVVGGVLSILHTKLARPDSESLVDLANQLMSMLVLPYLGSAAARRELERPVITRDSAEHGTMLLADPFREAGMRWTYRTVRVLLAVAEHEGASNRLIGESSEIKDQGQISKLLGRLARLGLVSNTGLGPGQGAPNSWVLTVKGRVLTDSIQVHMSDSSER